MRATLAAATAAALVLTPAYAALAVTPNPNGVQSASPAGTSLQSLQGSIAGDPTPAVVSTIYDNTPAATEGVFTTGLRQSLLGDDVTTTLFDANNPVMTRLTSINFGVDILAGTTAFTAEVTLFDDFDFAANAMTPTPSTPVLLTPFSAFTVSFAGLSGAAITSLTGPIDLTGLNGGAPVSDDGDFFVQLRFLDGDGNQFAATGSPVTAYFDGTGVNAGQSADFFLADTDADGTLDANEGFFFGGPPNLANFGLRFDGEAVAVPEPATAGLLAFAGFGLLARRRR